MDICLDPIRFSIRALSKTQSIQICYQPDCVLAGKYSQDNEKQIGNLLTFMFLHDMVTIAIVTFILQTFTFKNASIP